MSDSISRSMWKRFEPIHSIVYFTPQAATRYKEAGMKGGWMGYFASRSAPLGKPSAEVVQALFYNFAPQLVKRAIPDAWSLSTPENLIQLRTELAVDVINASCRDLIEDPGFIKQIDHVLKVATSLPVEGRALYAANLKLDWSASTASKLFGAATLLREHRGDTHNAALVANQINGIEAHILQLASGAFDYDTVFPNRGWSEQEWESATQEMIRRELLARQSTSQSPILTDLGKETKNRIETATDLGSNPWNFLLDSEVSEMSNLLELISNNVKRQINFPQKTPIGL